MHFLQIFAALFWASTSRFSAPRLCAAMEKPTDELCVGNALIAIGVLIAD
jgi:hypothetical protein